MNIVNGYLDELIGKSFNQKVRNDARKYMREQQAEFFGGHIPMMKETAVISATKDGEIKGLGASCVNDIFTDNFGKWLSYFMQTPSTVQREETMQNTSDATTTFRFFSGATLINDSTPATGHYFRLGSGSTAPARGDYTIETALVTAPENTYFGTGNGVWNSGGGDVTCSNSVVAGGSGDVRESGWFGEMQANTAVAHKILLAHDAISPAVSFVASDTLTCEYTFNM